jgi:glutamate-1-semialdehyde aminotransferase
MFWMVFGEIKTSDGVVRAASETPAVQKEQYAKVFHALLEGGIYLAPSGYEVSFLSTAHQDSHLSDLVGKMGGALRR